HGIQVLRVESDSLDTIEKAIARARRERAQALMILGDTFFVQYFRQIAAATAKNRLPSIYSGREYPDAGGLMSYGPDFPDSYPRAGRWVYSSPAHRDDQHPRGRSRVQHREGANTGALPVAPSRRGRLGGDRKAGNERGAPPSAIFAVSGSDGQPIRASASAARR